MEGMEQNRKWIVLGHTGDSRHEGNLFSRWTPSLALANHNRRFEIGSRLDADLLFMASQKFAMHSFISIRLHKAVMESGGTSVS